MAQPKKEFFTRIQHKHDIESNWLKAENFTPLSGELIVYDEDDLHPYKRIKIGNNNSKINELKFIGTDEIFWINATVDLNSDDTMVFVLDKNAGEIINAIAENKQAIIKVENGNSIVAVPFIGLEENAILFGAVYGEQYITLILSTESATNNTISLIQEFSYINREEFDETLTAINDKFDQLEQSVDQKTLVQIVTWEADD